MKTFGEKLASKLVENRLALPNMFKGFSKQEVETVMLAQSVKRLPQNYIQFLLKMGHEGAEGIYLGSDYRIGSLKVQKTILKNSMSLDKHDNVFVPDDAFVFLGHQGYQFFFFLTDNTNDDPPVFIYMEEGGPPQVGWPTLSAHFEGMIQYALSMR